MNSKTLQRNTLALITATTLALVASAASAAIINVTTLDDTVANDGECSLREAVIAANQNGSNPYLDCPDGTAVGTDYIWVLLAGTINLSSNLPLLEKVEILGGGKDATTISGQGFSSVFYVNMPDDTHDVKISNLTIADGKETLPGAGLLVDRAGTVRVEQCRFRDNESGEVGGAIGTRLESGTSGSLKIVQCEFINNRVEGHGGAIGIDGIGNAAPVSVEIDRSSFVGNFSSANGGALYLYNTNSVSVDRSRFHDNETDSPGASNGQGGAIFWQSGAINSGSMTIDNSSFIDNIGDGSGGAIYISRGQLANIVNSTFSGNYSRANYGNALLANSGITAFFHNSLVGNDLPARSSDSVLVASSGASILMTHNIVWTSGVSTEPSCRVLNDGEFISNCFNIDSGSTCGTHASDYTNVIDAGLFDLDDYGDNTGALVLETFLPRPGGLAIDGGKDGPCTEAFGDPLVIDQRGTTRAADGDGSGGNAECDIGAVEYQPGDDPIARTLSLAAPGNGRIIDSNGKVLCYTSISPCDHELPDGTIITLTASAYNDYEFVGWSGDCAASGTGDCTLTMDQNFSATANFQAAAVPATLQVSKSLAEAGLDATVTSAPSGINCGVTCSAGFAVDDVIVLTAAPQPGTVVSGWIGCDSVSGNGLQCTITLAGDSQVEASLGVEGVSIFRNGFE
ncbi:MAG: CSLREA domain-containing protein [Lysobacteraceae bacterium]